MDQKYGIFYYDKQIGQATVNKRGLYYEISCRCELPDKQIYRIIISTESSSINLGVYIPIDGCAGLVKKIPVKCLDGLLDFRFQAVTEMITQGFKLEEHVPLLILEHLERCYLKNDVLYISNNIN